MRRIDLIEINKELFQKLKKAGIHLEDYKYCGLYHDYLRLSETMKTRKEVILTLSQNHGITDRQVYNILRHLEKPVGLAG